MTDRGSNCLWNRGEGHLPSEVVLPACLLGFLPPEILRKMEARCKPRLDWHPIAAISPGRRPGPCLPYRRHLGPFTITPCSQTGKQCPGHAVLKLLPPKIGVVSSSSPKLSCPGPLWRRAPLFEAGPSCGLCLFSLCVWPCLWQHSHIPQRLLVELLGAAQQMLRG